ncbi:MAG: DUF4366 domain-containing protein [Holdemanella sp.]|nr:DUF4366 domain-containing protein [Holdemanella sp.]
MAKLSRKERYKELRSEIEKDMLQTRITQEPSRIQINRVNKEEPTHAKTSAQPQLSQQSFNQILSPYGQSTTVMDDILGEVKQYNIDNGNRITDDTQINILNQLDKRTFTSRNQHIMPMDEEEENLGSTMEMPKTSDVDGVTTYLPNQKLKRVNPITLSKYDDFKQQPDFDDFKIGFDDEPVMKPTITEPKKDRLVLTNDDIGNTLSSTDSMDIYNAGMMQDDFDKTEEQPVEKKKDKKKKKKSKKERKVEKELPSAKEKIVEEEDEEDEPKSKSSSIINIILTLLIIALIGSIGFTIYFIMKMGK